MKLKYLFIFVLSIGFGSFLFAQVFFRGKTLGPDEVKKKWGSVAFDAQKFKTGDFDLKAKMAYEILINKKFKGVSVVDIREQLGSPDGFYFIDTYPAYIIQSGKSRKEETWQIVFLLNSEFRVRDIIVHKNCCDE